MLKILVTGAKGMLGRTLMRRLGQHECCGVDIDDFDITDRIAVDRALRQYSPDAVIHCAAMTAVDECETEPERARKINAEGAANVAQSCEHYGSQLIAISTDYVFSGDSERPYGEYEQPSPRTVYGKSKLAGEQAVVQACKNHLIVRIAWLYGPGGPSFVHTMLKLGTQQGQPIKIVDDQIGNPTSTDAVASHLMMLLGTDLPGTIHLACEGRATWYQFARRIFLLAGLKRDLIPCSTAEYPLPAPRPANSCLANRAIRSRGLPRMPRWHDALANFFEDYPNG